MREFGNERIDCQWAQTIPKIKNKWKCWDLTVRDRNGHIQPISPQNRFQLIEFAINEKNKYVKTTECGVLKHSLPKA